MNSMRPCVVGYFDIVGVKKLLHDEKSDAINAMLALEQNAYGYASQHQEEQRSSLDLIHFQSHAANPLNPQLKAMHRHESNKRCPKSNGSQRNNRVSLPGRHGLRSIAP